jgi:hypothetical protein
MTIFVVITNDYEGSTLHALFSTREKAESFIAEDAKQWLRSGSSMEIEEHILDEHEHDVAQDYWAWMVNLGDGREKDWWPCPQNPHSQLSPAFETSTRIWDGNMVGFSTRSLADAQRVAREAARNYRTG